MNALLLLEDGTLFEGAGFGAPGEAFGEVVFNTSITGYQEILTDPSYRGQIVSMTFPQIGNYGVNEADRESRRTWLSGLAVKELSAVASSWRATGDLASFLAAGGVVGIQGIDTRALTRHLRINGAKHGVISTTDADPRSLARKLEAAPRIVGVDLVREVTCEHPYEWTEPVEGRPADASAPGSRRRHVVVLDCGVKFNILRHLVSTGFRVTVVPASTDADAIMAREPDGVLLSNGPGDPEPVKYVVDTVRALIGRVPLFGICLGHQMLGLALGGRTYKLKFGHHGGNHPVKDLETGRIAITSQNHGFNVDMESLGGAACATHVNLFDGTTEGLEARGSGLFGVQYHPEAGPGPHDADRLFDRFADLVAAGRG
jgi:carbamoyl-phosphate synthase small subunit